MLVAQMLINNWDLKTSNNKIIERPAGGSTLTRLYVVRDLGASLGSNEQAKWLRWTQLRIAQGSKNDLPGFEESGFIDGVEDGYVKFAYSGPNKYLLAGSRRRARAVDGEVDGPLVGEAVAGCLPRRWHRREDTARYIAKFQQIAAESRARRWQVDGSGSHSQMPSARRTDTTWPT